MEMFLGLMLLCDPNSVDTCAVIRGPFFETYEECVVNLSTEGLTHVGNSYGRDIHIAYFDCIDVELQGEPT